MNSDTALNRLKILIVDDEPVNVTLLEHMLRSDGYTRFQSVTDSRTALAAIAEFEPDLILLDLMMPHVDGFAVLEALRFGATNTFLPVLVLTADSNDSSRRRALAAGATDFLLKPFDKTEVLLRIRNLLETRRVHVLLDNQRAALEEAVRDRTAELNETIARLRKAESTADAAAR